MGEGSEKAVREQEKRGRKLIIFTDEMKAYTHNQWIRGVDMVDIAESLGMGVATLFRKIAEDEAFSSKLRRERMRRRTKYSKKDKAYWDELISKGATNRRLRRALQWKKFELMNKKNISYRQVLGILQAELDRAS